MRSKVISANSAVSSVIVNGSMMSSSQFRLSMSANMAPTERPVTVARSGLLSLAFTEPNRSAALLSNVHDHPAMEDCCPPRKTVTVLGRALSFCRSVSVMKENLVSGNSLKISPKFLSLVSKSFPKYLWCVFDSSQISRSLGQ